MHANTPTLAHFDGLGRTFLTIADNGKDSSGDASNTARAQCSISIGNQREVIDALGRVVMRYDYDMLKAKIHQTSMEAGERWMLNDATGKPIRGWNSRNYAFRTEYDALHRPLKSYVKGGDPSEPNPSVFAHEILFEQTIYGDSADAGLTAAQQAQANLTRQSRSGISTARGSSSPDLYDFKGNSLRGAASSRATTRTRRTGRKTRRWKPRLFRAPPPMTRSIAPSRRRAGRQHLSADVQRSEICWKRSTSICAAR